MSSQVGPKTTADQNEKSLLRKLAWPIGLVLISIAVYLMATAETGPVDPTEDVTQTAGQAVFNSAIIVFREGLEAVLIFAAVIASFQGANLIRRRPVVLGAVAAFVASIITWFVAQAVLDAASSLGPKLEAITGFLAIVVLLIVLNWFVHNVYWSEWIGRHHRQRRKLLAGTGAGITTGLVALGFTSVYREGFESVLFLQSLDLKYGTSTVLKGVSLGLAGTALVGVAVFWLHSKLPYRKMLLWTGVLVAVVLMVMIGGTALTFQDLGWLPRHDVPFKVPEWLGSWFEIYPYWETIAAQITAGMFVAGSFYLAEYVKTRSLQAKIHGPAAKAETPPEQLATS